MLNGKSPTVNSSCLLQFTINDLPFNFYETVHHFTFTFRLLSRRVSSGCRAAFDFKQTGFEQRHSADKFAAAAVKTFARNVLDNF